MRNKKMPKEKKRNICLLFKNTKSYKQNHQNANNAVQLPKLPILFGYVLFMVMSVAEDTKQDMLHHIIESQDTAMLCSWVLIEFGIIKVIILYKTKQMESLYLPKDLLLSRKLLKKK